jgi:cell division protein FtsW
MATTRKVRTKRAQTGGGASATLVVQRIGALAFNWFSDTFRKQSRDFNNLLGITCLLVAFGLVMVLSASYVTSLGNGEGAFSVFFRQAVSAALGFIALGVLSRTSVARIQKIAPLFFLLMLAAQITVVFFGVEIYGNRNWLRIGSFQFQPSEFLKIGLLLVLAAMLVQRRDNFHDFKLGWLVPVFTAAAATGLVLGGSDLGTAIVMFGFSFVMMVLIGMPKRIALSIFAIAAAGALIFANMGSRRTRILAWLNPDAVDVTGATWQARHGIWALAAGGIGGTGLGDSKMKWNWIPMVDNDYIFSVVGEEWGMIGATVLIALYVLLAMALIRILNRTDRLFERYVMYGILCWITIQSFINIGVVLNFLPVLGVPLPLISAGGTSLLATLATLGIALGIERRNSASGSQVRVQRTSRQKVSR